MNEDLPRIIERVGEEKMADGIESFVMGGSLRLIAKDMGIVDNDFLIVIRCYIQDLQDQLISADQRRENKAIDFFRANSNISDDDIERKSKDYILTTGYMKPDQLCAAENGYYAGYTAALEEQQ